MTVLCAIPLQIPVHRIRVTAKCLATGGPVHTAALRLADYWGESPEEIAEVLGLPIYRAEHLLQDPAARRRADRTRLHPVGRPRPRTRAALQRASGVAVKPAATAPSRSPSTRRPRTA